VRRTVALAHHVGLIAIAIVLILIAGACERTSSTTPVAVVQWFAADMYYHPRGDFYATWLRPVSPARGAPLPGRSLRLPDSTAERPIASPDGRLAAFGGNNDGEVLLVDLTRMQLLRDVTLHRRSGDNTVSVLAWPSRHRLLLLIGPAGGKHPTPQTLQVVDPFSGRRLARFAVGYLLDWAAAADGRAVLLGYPTKRLGPPRLLSLSRDGSLASLTLTRLLASRARADVSREPIDWEPALAVDFRDSRAVVIDAPGRVADIALTPLRVGYRRLRWAGGVRRAGWQPPHDTGTVNPTEGGTRYARWLGHDRIALTGYDSRIAGHLQADRPLGFALVDARTWKVRRLNSSVQWNIEEAHNTVLVGDANCHDRVPGNSNTLTAYTLTGGLRYQLKLGCSGWSLERGRLYTGLAERQGILVEHEVGSGRVVRRFRADDQFGSMFSWPLHGS
jgi:hypothetical protein